MIFNMVGGGGGGLKNTDAVLIVTVPTGSTVTATKNGVTLTPTIWVQNADNTLDTAIFSIKASTFDSNAWTVTATLNGNTASDTVVVNGAYEYNIALYYRVPSEYQEVAYIENTGTQYIVTNHQAGLDYTLAINIQVGGTTQNKPVFSSSEGTYYSMTCFNSAWSIGINGAFVDGNGSYSPVIGTEYDIVFNDSNHDCIVNGTTIRSNMNATANGKLVIGARLKGGDGSSVDVYGAYRFEYAKLTQISTGDVIMELIPCYRILDSVAGMWDRVDKVFYTNSGSGTFVVGADV